MQLSDHFKDTELGVAGCEERILDNATWIAETLLEPIRSHFGPIFVHDGYRDPGHNARVGGKTDSYHLFEGTKAAVDISAATISIGDLFDWIRLDSGLPFDKVILERNEQGFAACVHLQGDRAATPRREAYTGQTGAGTVYIPVPVK